MSHICLRLSCFKPAGRSPSHWIIYSEINQSWVFYFNAIITILNLKFSNATVRLQVPFQILQNTIYSKLDADIMFPKISVVHIFSGLVAAVLNCSPKMCLWLHWILDTPIMVAIHTHTHIFHDIHTSKYGSHNTSNESKKKSD